MYIHDCDFDLWAQEQLGTENEWTNEQMNE